MNKSNTIRTLSVCGCEFKIHAFVRASLLCQPAYVRTHTNSARQQSANRKFDEKERYNNSDDDDEN